MVGWDLNEQVLLTWFVNSDWLYVKRIENFHVHTYKACCLMVLRRRILKCMRNPERKLVVY